DLQSILDSLGATHARTVRPFLVAGADALDHDDRARDLTGSRVAQPGFQIQLGDDLGAVISVPVFLRLVFAGAGGDDHHSVLERLDAVAIGNGGFEMADGTFDGRDPGVGKQVN